MSTPKTDTNGQIVEKDIKGKSTEIDFSKISSLIMCFKYQC